MRSIDRHSGSAAPTLSYIGVMRPEPAYRHVAGFTLLELMAAIAVLGVLLGLAVPSFTEVIRNNRTAAQANDLIGALHLTRSEASKRGMPISICAADAAQAACAGAAQANWANGWIVFTDREGNPGVIDGGDMILITSAPVRADIALTTGASGFVRYAPNGASMNGAVTFGVEHNDCSDNNRRTIAINTTGRVALQKGACS